MRELCYAPELCAVAVFLVVHRQRPANVRPTPFDRLLWLRLRLDLRDYLADILSGLANTSIQTVAGLTPAAWTAKRH
jgi:hypothetical protein